MALVRSLLYLLLPVLTCLSCSTGAIRIPSTTFSGITPINSQISWEQTADVKYRMASFRFKDDLIRTCNDQIIEQILVENKSFYGFGDQLKWRWYAEETLYPDFKNFVKGMNGKNIQGNLVYQVEVPLGKPATFVRLGGLKEKILRGFISRVRK
ncbi:hypothetical protein [Leptospira ilyithenensis]|uniref:Uncharacterized protein n=1 Tax=Leptospira ilyithenensis TaxID=2484901 RepID=A0A4R9LPV8_9LEPT|nr:hypothetical protein [Leptospira ilyithenensis]TGN10166.1 hypothetical protein EHS11_10400 [Leptospira ilyithenensis]